MDFSWPALRRGRTPGTSWSNRSYSIGVSSKKPSGVIAEIHTKAQWQAYMDVSKANNKLLVIEFTANWCGPCRFVEPMMKELAATYTDVDFVRIDVDEMAGIAEQFGVQVLPTFLLLRKGKEVGKVTGVKKKELQNKIEIMKLSYNGI
uniref:Thioredoxin domain-containing protein n=1 Tax=Rhizophora mucronata TaxID=61149 RepID=A0A2P2Q2Y2_RHIMU